MQMIAFLLIAIGFHAVAGQRNQSPRQWRPAQLQGLIVGKSRRSDMLRRLGQPKWTRSHDSGEKGEERQTFSHYEAGGDFAGSLTVVLNKNGLIERIDFFPAKLSRDEAVSRYGADYAVTRYALEPCGDEDEESLYESTNGPLTYLEYRSRGIAIALGNQNMVTKISYVARPIGHPQSTCK
jgi:hypothetical protein